MSEALVSLATAEEQSLTLLGYARDVVIDSHEEHTAAAQVLTDLAALTKAIEAHFKPRKQELDAQKKLVVEQERAVLEGPARVRAVLAPKILDYQRRENARRQEEARQRDLERLKEAETARLQAGSRAEAQGNRSAAEAIVRAPVVVAPTPVSTTKAKGIGVVTRWTFRIVDPAMVPRQFLLVDEKKLRGYATAMKDQAEVPGVEFFTEESVSVKATREVARYEAESF